MFWYPLPNDGDVDDRNMYDDDDDDDDDDDIRTFKVMCGVCVV